MAEEEDWGSDSSGDEDYIPIAPSDDESDPDASELVPEDDPEFGHSEESNVKKRPKKKTKKKNDAPRARKGGIKLDEEDLAQDENDKSAHNVELEKQIEEEKQEKSEEQKKKKADDLWASFMADVGTPSRPKPVTPQVKTPSSSTKIIKTATTAMTASLAKPSTTSNKTVTITKEFDFAGETVRVTKEVAANSKDAETSKKAETSAEPAKPSRMPFPGNKRSSGGLGSVLGKIDKKPKISTLEKSKLDWQSFKQKEGISEELEQHNKGKLGFLERKAFLERTDQREYELERDVRLKTGKR